jgi:hypothetical protein
MRPDQAPAQDAASLFRAKAGVGRTLLGVAFAGALATSCGGPLDVGRNVKDGPLTGMEADDRNPVILLNDSWADNWSGELIALYANTGGPSFAGIVINGTKYWPDIDANMAGWTEFAATARKSGLKVPDPVRSEAVQLTVPADRVIESTVSHGSDGAWFIVNKSRELAQPWQPVVVLACSQLTDLADAYLIDRDVVNRVVVVAQLGSYSAPRGLMTGPNGDLDPWADWIVAQKFRYTQVGIFYDQGIDVTEADAPSLPANDFGTWMRRKIPSISKLNNSSDQETILSLAAPNFVAGIVQTAPDLSAGFNSPFGQGPPLVPNPNGRTWVISRINSDVARAQIWSLLKTPGLF